MVQIQERDYEISAFFFLCSCSPLPCPRKSLSRAQRTHPHTLLPWRSRRHAPVFSQEEQQGGARPWGGTIFCAGTGPHGIVSLTRSLDSSATPGDVLLARVKTRTRTHIHMHSRHSHVSPCVLPHRAARQRMGAGIVPPPERMGFPPTCRACGRGTGNLWSRSAPEVVLRPSPCTRPSN